MWNMKDKTCICILGGTIQRVKEMAGMVILCVFIILLCMLFAAIGIVWLLQIVQSGNWRRLDAYEEKAKKETSC